MNSCRAIRIVRRGRYMLKFMVYRHHQYQCNIHYPSNIKFIRIPRWLARLVIDKERNYSTHSRKAGKA